jgi:hypothetical protein
MKKGEEDSFRVFWDQKRFLGSQEIHRKFTGKSIEMISLFLRKYAKSMQKVCLNPPFCVRV